jgi:hypothetical protein
MQRQTLRRYLACSLLIASLMLAATPVMPQERKMPGDAVALPIVQNSCPKPVALTLTATTPYVENADFTATQLGAPRAWLNDPVPNKSFLYTFRWTQDQKCCEITRAVLTVRMKSNQQGQSLHDSWAGNDGIAIMHMQSVVLPYSQAVYGSFAAPVAGSPAVTYPFPAGQPSVKTWTLTGATLNNLNMNRRLSLYIQDDTMVQSATLQIWGCCLSK